MKKSFLFFIFYGILILILMSTPAYAEIVKTLNDTGKAAVAVPVNLVKFVGGIFKLIGEVLLLPFRAL